MNPNRKTDRRTLYTLAAIKDTFLELEKEFSFEKISVKKLCEKAEISRTTFYLHYDSIDDVLDAVIDDALLFSEKASGTAIDLIDVIQSGRIHEISENEAVLPACQRIADSDKYHDLFMDSSLSEYIIMRISNHEKDRIVPELMTRTGLDEEYAEMIFKFMLHGSFYVNKSLKWEKTEKWYNFQKTLSAFLDAGMNALLNDLK
ncbi:Transcriptional regulator, TetR family [Lachnospiraceae bacterium TWA4]|nr:Transcriptional regulator, TetR family [Lachnospiraceae bacterium TWA4]